MRLNRFLASAGLGSRRACEELITSGRVSLNGHVVTNLATTVGPDDQVRVGRKLVAPRATTTLILYKPPGYVCTRSDELGRKTIFALVPDHFGRLFHIGRLDKESEGLILLTNDGDLSQYLTHPSHQIEKEYEVVLDQPFDTAHTAKLLRGITIEAGRARMENVRVLAPNKLRIVLKQGLKRQIRDMLWRLGYRVTKLVRTRIGPLREPAIKPGQFRVLNQRELESLRKPSR